MVIFQSSGEFHAQLLNCSLTINTVVLRIWGIFLDPSRQLGLETVMFVAGNSEAALYHVQLGTGCEISVRLGLLVDSSP